jgi:calcineurin-like phosphoesterase
MTLWDHIFDNFDNIKDCIFNKNSNLLAFANFYDEELASSWAKVFEKNGKKLLVIHLQGEMFMNYKVVNPFLKAKEILKKYEKEKLDWIIVDFHREVTSEVYGLANYLDGEVGFVFGTHTHIQTNDERILKNGTGMICDVWMSWPLDSIIWVSFDSVKKRFLTGIAKWKLEQALGKDYVVSGVFVELWKKGKCEKVEKIRIVKS